MMLPHRIQPATMPAWVSRADCHLRARRRRPRPRMATPVGEPTARNLVSYSPLQATCARFSQFRHPIAKMHLTSTLLLSATSPRLTPPSPPASGHLPPHQPYRTPRSFSSFLHRSRRTRRRSTERSSGISSASSNSHSPRTPGAAPRQRSLQKPRPTFRLAVRLASGSRTLRSR